MDGEHVQIPDQDDTAYERIARQLAGEASESERADLAASLMDAENRAMYDAASAHWAAARPAQVDVDAGWARVQARLAAYATAEPVKVLELHTRVSWWRANAGLMRAAAVGFVLVTASIVWSRTSGERKMDERGPVPVATTLVAETGIAQRSVVRLPDGSEVHLGPAGSLRTIDGFGKSAREVMLTGEAVFRVQHDAARPFRVHTGTGVKIEDLGTEFVVRAIVQEPIRVAVSEGSVSVRGMGARDTATLHPRDVAVLSGTGAVVQRNVDVDRYSAWARERVELIFDNTPLRSVFTELERWYDVKFEVTDPAVLTRTLNAPVAGVSIDEVLQVMNTALELRFERNGRVVRLAAPVRTGMTSPSAMQVGGGA